MRKLPAAAQEERRRQVIGLRQARWLRREYPAIVARARQARGIIFWGDETGLRSDDVRGRSYAPRGRTPLVRVCHKRAGLSLISAVTNRGELRWMIVDRAVNGTPRSSSASSGAWSGTRGGRCSSSWTG